MTERVDFSPEALTQLSRLFRYIAEAASPSMAERYTDSIVSYCESLHTFPERGTRRDDIRPGLRMTYYRKRVAIAFTATATGVSIFGVFTAARTTRPALANIWSPERRRQSRSFS